MAGSGRLKGDPGKKDTKFNNSDMDDTKEMKSELTKRATEHVEMPKEGSGRLVYFLHFLYKIYRK